MSQSLRSSRGGTRAPPRPARAAHPHPHRLLSIALGVLMRIVSVLYVRNLFGLACSVLTGLAFVYTGLKLGNAINKR